MPGPQREREPTKKAPRTARALCEQRSDRPEVILSAGDARNFSRKGPLLTRRPPGAPHDRTLLLRTRLP